MSHFSPIKINYRINMLHLVSNFFFSDNIVDCQKVKQSSFAFAGFTKNTF